MFHSNILTRFGIDKDHSINLRLPPQFLKYSISESKYGADSELEGTKMDLALISEQMHLRLEFRHY